MDNQSNPHTREDLFDLDRFVQAQADVYEQALAELKRGQKESHWIWFIFPQIDGLGRSPTARLYAIKSSAEARAYLNHPLLGPRLIECSRALLQVKGKSASEILDFPDDLKLRSSMTLFDAVSEPDSVVSHVLRKYFAGRPDRKTLDLLQQGTSC
jgi:uncharacterized protein (DUF1810 family)